MNHLVGSMSPDDEKWIREHRIKYDMWRIFFLERDDFWRNREINTEIARTMTRDILDAKKDRVRECPFCKNPHLAQLSSMLGLDIKGKKSNQQIIKDRIVKAIAT